MTKRERIQAAIEGRRPDRTPYSLWYHFRLDPPAGDEMAEAELAFYRAYQPDLLKVMHDIPYEMPQGMPLIRSAEDWRKLPVLDGISGNFGRQLYTVNRIITEKGDDAPVIDTVFGVFSTAQKLCGKRTLEHLRSDPDSVHAGLRNIAESLSNYTRAVIEKGADGIYLAVSGCASDTMPEEEYRKNFLQYDQQVLNAAAKGTTSVLHHHGAGIYPEATLGLNGFQIFSWSDRIDGNPGIREMRLKHTGCLMGGVDEVNFGSATADQVVQQAKEAIAASDGLGFILAPGCAVPTPPASSEENLKAFGRAVTV